MAELRARPLLFTLFAALVAHARAWGLCNDNDISCAGWANAGQCEGNDHIKELCPHSCAVCDHRCRDLEEGCAAWADGGECKSNVDYMLRHCPSSCGACKPLCYDKDPLCAAWARAGECAKNPSTMLGKCSVSCGVCTELCMDRSNDCPGWAASGACGENPGFMLHECPNSCGVCTPAHHAASGHPATEEAQSKTSACADLDRNQCLIWGVHECQNNPGAMLRECPHTCGVCTLACEDKYADCPNWAEGRANVFGRKGGPMAGCDQDPAFMKVNCPQSCNVCRDVMTAPPVLKSEL